MNFSRNLLQSVAAVIFYLSGVIPVVAQSASSGGFGPGNSCYTAGDFKGAVKNYEAGIRDDYVSANLFYNLGNAYYRLGDRGHAILNYRRALALEPSHAEAAANLAFVGGDKDRGPAGTKSAWWQTVPWVVAVLGWLGAVGLLMALANRRRRLLGLGLLATGWTLCAAGMVFIWFLGGDEGGTTARAVVIKEAVPALYSPADNSKVMTSLAAGSEVRVLSEQGAWDYVVLGDGNTRAWLAASSLENFVPK